MAESLAIELVTKLGSVFAAEVNQAVGKVVGVDKTVRDLETTLESIRLLLADAEKQQVKEQAVRSWLMKLKELAYDLEDVLDDWSIVLDTPAVHEPRSRIMSSFSLIPPPCSCFKKAKVRYDIAQKLEEINERLERIATDKIRYTLTCTPDEPKRLKTTSFDVDESLICGRVLEKTTLVEKLCSIEKRGIEVISVVGMGGIGKTTLAQMVFNDANVTSHFNCKIWVCVSDPFDQITIARLIIEAVTGNTPITMELQTLLINIASCITGKRFLLVLDDVWNEDERKWEPLKNALNHGAYGSAVLVTTRKDIVADKMAATYKLPLSLLSEEDCWSLFSCIALSSGGMDNKHMFKGEIVNKCKGLPLAARLLGGLLRLKESNEEWERILQSDLWQVEEAKSGLFPSLLLSYYDLPPEVQRCFAYCAIFPKDYNIEKDMLIGLWGAQGFLNLRQDMEMQAVGEHYFNVLLSRSFFIDLGKQEVRRFRVTFKMHDIVHDFAQYLSENEIFHFEVRHSVQLGSASSSRRKVRHVACTTGEYSASFPSEILYMKGSQVNISRSRAFLVLGWHRTFDESLGDFTYLKALVARDNNVREIPEEIGKLLNLQLLDLSNCQYIKELPESLCNLYNLQILNLRECSSLLKLPEGIGKLASLRHLMIDETPHLQALPSGITRLTSLRELNKFIVTRSDNNQGSNVRDLVLFPYLGGLIRLVDAGLVTNEAEARSANLKNKRHIVRVELDLCPQDHPGCEMEEMSRHLGILKGLEPPPNVNFLLVEDYRGLRFPDWIGALNNLKILSLMDCWNSVCLPPLGELKSLVILRLYRFPVLKEVGVEFLTRNPGTTSFAAFEKLEALIIVGMPSWEEWRGPQIGGEETGKLTDSIMMPRLTCLQLTDCPALKSLPRFLQATPLQELYIQECDSSLEDDARMMGYNPLYDLN